MHTYKKVIAISVSLRPERSRTPSPEVRRKALRSFNRAVKAAASIGVPVTEKYVNGLREEFFKRPVFVETLCNDPDALLALVGIITRRLCGSQFSSEVLVQS